MSQVHDSIVMASLSVQEAEIKKAFKPFIRELKTSCWYPDIPASVKKDIPEDVRFLYPDPPRTAWQKDLVRMGLQSKFWTWCGQPPLNEVYLCSHYIKNAVRSLKNGDLNATVKYCGVYSHVIADVIEPGHAVFDWIMDVFSPAPSQNPQKTKYTNKECLRGPADIKGYCPKLLGDNLKQVEMAMIADLIEGSRYGAALAAPLEQALYSGRIKEGRRLHSSAQNEAARKFADFIHTVFHLAGRVKEKPESSFDLCKLQFIAADISCQSRFRPLVDVFLDPSNFAKPAGGPYLLKSQPLALLSDDGRKANHVHGLSVLPGNTKKAATVDYLLVPGAYGTLSSRVGFNPAFKKSLPFVSAVFSVVGDGKVLARTKPVKLGGPPVRVRAELGKTRFLTLSMRYSGNLSSKQQKKLEDSASAAHGVWAEPVLHSA